MKILSIDSPKRLQDRKVKASITVSEEDYIPLIMLADRAYKGDEIEIDDAGEKDKPLQQEFITITEIIHAYGLRKFEEGRRIVKEEMAKEDV